MKNAMFERDILYPTDKKFEPGSVHIAVYPPENSGSIPVVIEAKTVHNPMDYINDILGIMQADIFDRIKIEVRKNGLLFIRSIGEQHYFRVTFNGDMFNVAEVKDLESII